VTINIDASIVGLAVQWVGIGLVAILFLLLAQSVRRKFLAYWAMSWTFLAMALTALLFAFTLPISPKVFFTLYFLFEYAFGFLLIAGCRNHSHGTPVSLRDFWFLAPASVAALVLPQLSDDFNLILIPHAAIVSCFWITAYQALKPKSPQAPRGLGLRIVSLALILLAIDFVQYFVACTYAQATHQVLPFPYLKYSSLYDLILEILLAFGTVVIVMETLHQEMTKANKELHAASLRLQALAEKDPLTDALNRHAYYSLLGRQEGNPSMATSGSVVVTDIDDFKSINDTFGHAAGDDAIRKVAGAIRSVIRADDLLFRWGGDEFLVVAIGLSAADARRRLDTVNSLLASVLLPGCGSPIPLAISFGIAAIEDGESIEDSIHRADLEMFRAKRSNKDNASRLASSQI
jgi:diguanylate cyclase (GGDEF)-like protein